MNLTRNVLILGLLSLAACGGMDMSLPAPTSLKVEELSGGAHLTWKDNATNEAMYMVERKDGSGAFKAIKSDLEFDTTAYHDAPLMAGVVYTYRVMAMGKDGKSSPYSNEATFTLSSK